MMTETSSPAIAGGGVDDDRVSREVLARLETLSPKLRDVVELRYGADLSLAGVSEALNIPVGTVKSRLNAAMKTLGTNA